MNLAVLHHHLNRGGVTRVIQNHLLALDAVLKPGQVLPVALIYGGRRVDWPEDFPERLRSVRLTLHAVPSLDYDDQRPEDHLPPGTVEEQVGAVLDDLGFAPHETVVHVHNHAVGKNVCLPQAASALAERGYAMLLHVHDFVEDFRPANFQRFSQVIAPATPAAPASAWHGDLYPQAPHVHYAVLNGRDYRVLEAAGIDPDRLHWLPNPVREPAHLPPREDARRRLNEQFAVPVEDRFVLYPVRCIRRKNVGEALLYGKLAPPGTVVGLTLPPLNPAAIPVYTRWRQLAAEWELPCRFDVGVAGKLSFAESLAAADLILTTSVAEGFGMVFLESWLASRALVGRDLPEITADFKKAGVRLDRLQPQLQVPLEWVDANRVRQTVLDAYRLTLAAYGRAQPLDLSAGLDGKMKNDLIDFGDLDEPLQEQVIRRVSESDADRRQVLDCNPWIDRAFSSDADQTAELVRHNVELIGRRFSLSASGQQLLDLYGRAVSSPRAGRPKPLEHAARILDQFLDLKRFHLIRTDLTSPTPGDQDNAGTSAPA
jgi:hypothetical protein